MDNNQIIELYWQRDESAVEITVKQYESYCFKVANNILNNRQDAEECVNDTWIAVWNSIPPQRPKNLLPYIAKITHNLSVNRLKHKSATKRAGKNIAFEELENLLCGEDEFVEGINLEMLQGSINKFLHSSSEASRKIFIRRYFFCENVGEIAQKYRMSENNVAKILSRTRRKLKEYLEKEGYYI